MYTPAHFAESDPTVLHALVRAHSLATFVVNDLDGTLVVNHIPLLLEPGHGAQGRLIGHVARANPVWQGLAEGRPCVAVFQGPEAYITPSWYAAKREHGKVVPTWNYAVVHAHGVARAIDDQPGLRDLVSRLTDTHEARERTPWRVDDAPDAYIDQMLGAIVGLEVEVTRWEGKWKVSQNRPAADRALVAQGLADRGGSDALAMAALVQGQAG